MTVPLKDQRDRRQRSARDGAAGPVAAVHAAEQYAHAAPIGLTELSATCAVRVKNHTAAALGAVRPQKVDGRKTGCGTSTSPSTPSRRRLSGWDAAYHPGHGRRGLDLAVMFPRPRAVRAGLDSSEHVGSDGSSRRSPPPSPAPTTTGWPTTARSRRSGCSAPPWSRRTTSRAPCWRPAAAWRSSASRRCSSPGWSTAAPGTTPRTTRRGRRSSGSTCRCRFHGGGQTYLTPDFSLQVLDKLMLWHTLQPAARHPVRARSASPAAACSSGSRTCARAARGQLLVGAVAPRPPRRALRVDRLVRGAPT